jgi:hypothetical protein
MWELLCRVLVHMCGVACMPWLLWLSLPSSVVLLKYLRTQPFHLRVQEDDQDIIESLNDQDDMEDLCRRLDSTKLQSYLVQKLDLTKLQSYLVQKVGATGQAVVLACVVVSIPVNCTSWVAYPP